MLAVGVMGGFSGMRRPSRCCRCRHCKLNNSYQIGHSLPMSVKYEYVNPSICVTRYLVLELSMWNKARLIPSSFWVVMCCYRPSHCNSERPIRPTGLRSAPPEIRSYCRHLGRRQSTRDPTVGHLNCPVEGGFGVPAQ